jgi:hypothetical protein
MPLRTPRIIVAALALAATAGCHDTPSPTEADSPANPVLSQAALQPSPDGVWIVFFKPGIKDVRAEAQAIARAYGSTPEFVYEGLGGFAAKLPQAAAEALRRNPRISSISPNARVQLQHHTTQSGAPWGLDRIDQPLTGLDGNHHYAYSGSGVHIYVIDSGIRMSHQDFGGRAQFAYDPWGSNRQGNDCTDHGTRVASVAGGATYGVAKGATLWSVAAFDCYYDWMSRAILAIDWVATHHASPAVANLSFAACASSGGGSTGGEPPANVNNGGCTPGTHPGLDDAVGRLVASGVTTIVSAGNNNIDACQVSPARVPQVLTVAASGLYNQGGVTTDARWPSSNWGSCVDLFAPGVNIASASSAGDNAVATTAGATSLAAPFVTGVAARLLQREPWLTPSQVVARILNHHRGMGVANAGPGTPNGLLHYHDFPTAVTITTPGYEPYQDVTLTANLSGPTGGHSYGYRWSYDLCTRDIDGCGPGSGFYEFPDTTSNTYDYFFGSERWVIFHVGVVPPGGGAVIATADLELNWW